MSLVEARDSTANTMFNNQKLSTIEDCWYQKVDCLRYTVVTIVTMELRVLLA